MPVILDIYHTFQVFLSFSVIRATPWLVYPEVEA
jgi:hypothetical protein